MEFKKNKDKGKEYASFVEKELNDAGYFVKGQLVNFGEYGVPQKRTRFILVGVRKDLKNVTQETADVFFAKIRENKHSFDSKKSYFWYNFGGCHFRFIERKWIKKIHLIRNGLKQVFMLQ